jgi:hypothetical protein
MGSNSQGRDGSLFVSRETGSVRKWQGTRDPETVGLGRANQMSARNRQDRGKASENPDFNIAVKGQYSTVAP